MVWNTNRIIFCDDAISSYGNSKSLVFLSNMVFYCTNYISCSCIDIKWSKYKTEEKSGIIERKTNEVKLNVFTLFNLYKHFFIIFLFIIIIIQYNYREIKQLLNV